MGGRALVLGSFLTDPAGVPALAFLSTIHCAIFILRNHRSGKTARLSLLPAAVFAASPWVLSSPVWLVTAFAAHLAWFAACERYLTGADGSRCEPGAPVAAAGAVERKVVRATTGFRPVTVLTVLQETPEIRTFRVTRPEGFTFAAGQFVMVRVRAGAGEAVRCYSITSAPAAGGYLEIGVRRQGLVSSHLHEVLRPGARLDVSGPGGAFVYPAGDRPVVLIAGGIGITPLLSMLRHGLTTEPARPFTLLFSAKTIESIPFADELQLLARRHPQFRLAIALTAGSTDPRFLSGRIDRAAVESVVLRPAECVYMLCGPLPMIDEMRRQLAAAGVPEEQIRFEKFETAVAEAAGAAASVRVTLRDRRKTIEARGGQSVLEAVESAGEELPSLCRAGVCGTCRVRLISGSVDGDFDALGAGDRKAGFILACVARPRTDCVVET